MTAKGGGRMEIERVDGYGDPRFPPEVLRQHGAFLADNRPWAFRIISGHEAVVTPPYPGAAGLEEVAEFFRFYAGHITAFFDQQGRELLRLPAVERREVPIRDLQPTQFSVDREKCAAVGTFLETAADIVVPVAELDGALCVLDGHTRLYTAWQKGIRTAMVFSRAERGAWLPDFISEARRRGILHIEDMALYDHREQEERWHGWCRAYFSRRED